MFGANPKQPKICLGTAVRLVVRQLVQIHFPAVHFQTCLRVSFFLLLGA